MHVEDRYNRVSGEHILCREEMRAGSVAKGYVATLYSHLFDTILSKKLNSVHDHRHIHKRHQSLRRFICHGTKGLLERVCQ